ncbi:glycoside hydrolase family 1 protein [Metabacillus elymi]|uniref:Glycoside hydrolase family 1 protein n=1 Tax=Metabacillus elymi TaxID=2745198 RepID=A0ABX6S4M4_9BACI|nr:family 1 glycosylhydrolase [Metabacillus sp. KUDC1714]QNF28777.1 glycoside hydrolase family 1 protein [Metabacillus sp. KUDC1714]
MTFNFPPQFIWGSATAGHQVEGNNMNNDFWAEEHAEGSPYKDRSGDAIDHYRLYEKDIALMASLGLKAYRFSIEWSRIEPEQGEYSNSAIEHYRGVLEACHKYGITPVVAMHHFSSPKWLMRLGGWASPEIPELFSQYCEVVFRELGHLIPYTLTMNEVNLPVMLREVFSSIGFIPPVGIERDAWVAPKWRESAAQLCGTTADKYFTFHMISDEKSIKILKEAHKKAREVIKGIAPDTKVGFSMALSDIQSISGGEELAEKKWQSYFGQFEDMIAEDDFFGLQNYTRETYGPEGQVAPTEGTELTQMGYVYCPEALGNVIRKVKQAVSIPIMITEHGVATANDERRVEFIRRSLEGVQSCLNEGIDIIGYLHWSTFDNFEWNSGYSMQFGLIEVDRTTQERKVKESARYLGRIAQMNALVTK